MAVVVKSIPIIPGGLDLFHTTDPLLCNSPILIFYGQAAGPISTSSRIQVHIFTPAGFESYTRLSISPNSPHYAAVAALPREEQGDELCRGIAYALAKYFAELPPRVRETWIAQISTSKRFISPAGLFTSNHIAVLASRLARVENVEEVSTMLQEALAEQRLSWLDFDIVLPPSTVQTVAEKDKDLLSEDDISRRQYGKYAALVTSLTTTDSLVTSIIRRAPSVLNSTGRKTKFVVGQRETIRKEMCELVDTENNFVDKLADLCEHIGPQLRKCLDDSDHESSVERATLEALFPSSLQTMLDHHREFLTEAQAILDSTEEAAIEEIQMDETDPDNIADQADAIGITLFGRAMVKHFPYFDNGYSDYMAMHSQSTTLLRNISDSSIPTLTDVLHEIGEQRLTSLLIEPIQRLPRYTLYVDTMSKQLPEKHPALATLLKARNVISEICLSNDKPPSNAVILERLCANIDEMPKMDMESTRLVMVVDVAQIGAPYTLDTASCSDGLFLVFTTGMMFVEKLHGRAPSARALLNSLTVLAGASWRNPTSNSAEKSFRYVQTFSLKYCSLTEGSDGASVYLYTPRTQATTSAGPHALLMFRLGGIYAGRAASFTEELCRARVESRFGEEARAKNTWSLRRSEIGTDSVNMIAAIYERGQPADYLGQIRIEINAKDQPAVTKNSSLLQTCVRITSVGNTFCHVAIDSVHGSMSKEKVAMTDLAATISRQLSHVLHAHLTSGASPYQACCIARNWELMEALDLDFAASMVDSPELSTTKLYSKPSRPRSPVKSITNFIASKTGHGHSQISRKLNSSFSAVPNLQPALVKPATLLVSTHDVDGSAANNNNDESAEPGKQHLEEVLSSYFWALQARKGNVVGKVISSRRTADQSQVDLLYDSLLAESNSVELASQVPVDVLFSAFERFIKEAWVKGNGQIMDRCAIAAIQHEAECKDAREFEVAFHEWAQSLSPLNFRALRLIVRLLAELLDGTTNDADRGILTASFTEVLIPDQDPITCLSLLDRFVDQIEPLFGEDITVRNLESLPSPQPGHERSRATNTGSIGSNTSSFRRKFGFGGGIGVTRENSRTESESKVGSVWRSLSKSSKSGSDYANARPIIQRTPSLDIDNRTQVARASSRDSKPVVHGQFAFEISGGQDSPYLMPSSPLATIGETVVSPIAGAGAMKSGPDHAKGDASASGQSDIPSTTNTPSSATSSRPRPLSFGRYLQTSGDTPTKITTPNRTQSLIKTPQNRKENSPALGLGPSSIPRPRGSSVQVDEVVITAHTSSTFAANAISIASTTTIARPSSAATSNQPRVGLSEIPSANAIKIRPLQLSKQSSTKSPPVLTATSGPAKKLRLQSPQKLRERLQAEQRDLQLATSSIHTQIDQLGVDISTLTLSPPSSKATQPNSRIDSATPLPSTLSSTASPSSLVEEKLAALTQSVNTTLSTLQTSHETFSSDLLAALTQSESRTKSLEELYRVASAENDALYKRFNDELGKVLGRVKGGKGVEELRGRVKGLEEEMEGLRRDGRRLRRDLAGLKSRVGE